MDQVFRHEIDEHEKNGHETGGQDYRLKINYITMQCTILCKRTAEHKSQQQSKLYNTHMYNMLKCIKSYEKNQSKISYR